MRIEEIRQRARVVGVAASGKMRKAELIRAVQAREGNQACFATDRRVDCDQVGCCWRADCRPAGKEAAATAHRPMP
ncbi:MAG: SAP domain-containing protein [Desulfuromonadales bacterium]|nr:SAP domain-containing protein [Desulfuromonadales bacterium]